MDRKLLSELQRADLQALAKTNDIRATQKNDAIIEQLLAHPNPRFGNIPGLKAKMSKDMLARQKIMQRNGFTSSASAQLAQAAGSSTSRETRGKRAQASTKGKAQRQRKGKATKEDKGKGEGTSGEMVASASASTTTVTATATVTGTATATATATAITRAKKGRQAKEKKGRQPKKQRSGCQRGAEEASQKALGEVVVPEDTHIALPGIRIDYATPTPGTTPKQPRVYFQALAAPDSEDEVEDLVSHPIMTADEAVIDVLDLLASSPVSQGKLKRKASFEFDGPMLESSPRPSKRPRSSYAL